MPSDRAVAAMKARADDWRGYLRSLADNQPDISDAVGVIIDAVESGKIVDIPALCFDAHIDWTRSIKIIRAATSMSIVEAQTLLLEHDGWLRLVKRICQTDPACAKQLQYAATNNTLPRWVELRDGKADFLR